MISIIKTLIIKLITNIKKIFIKEDIKENILESKIQKYIKKDIESLKNDDVFESLQLNIKNNSKDLFQLSNFRDYSIKLWEISEQASRPLLVMIMGEFKTGKSTFINAILEEEVLKSDVTPATAVVSMISYGEERRVLAHFRDGDTKEYSFEELKNITAEGDDSKKELRNNIKYVELFIPKEILKSITIIDTPGLNVDNKLHIQATKEFMNEADMVFWVFSSGKAASRTEVAAISELSKRLKPMAIINRIDEIDEEEESLEEIIQEIKKRLKGSVDEVIGVSSFLAKKGMLENDQNAFSESKWADFTEKLDKEVLQKSESLKIESVLDKLNEYIEQFMLYLKETKAELIKMEEKFTNTTGYKKNLLKDIEYLKSVLNESVNVRKNREPITIKPDYLYECWKNKRKVELSKVDIPLNFLLKLVNVLKLLKGTEKIINNIQSYKDIQENVLEKIDKINNRVKQLNNIKKQLLDEFEEQQRQVNKYNNSGIFGGAPIFDWNGKANNLNNWKKDLDERNEDLKARFRSCKNDRLGEFSRLTRMNSEIYDYLPKIENVFKSNIKQSEGEIENFDKAFEAQKQKYNLLKDEILKADKVIVYLKKILENNKNIKIEIQETAATILSDY